MPLTTPTPMAADNLADALREPHPGEAVALPGWAHTAWTGAGPLGCGMPGERLAQRAAQRGFQSLKTCFAEAAATLDGQRGQWLQAQVLAAQEPIDLWLLRGALTAALVAAEGVAAVGLDAGTERATPAWPPATAARAANAAPADQCPHTHATDAWAGGRVRHLARTRARLERTLAEVFADAMDWPGSDFNRVTPVLSPLRAAA